MAWLAKNGLAQALSLSTSVSPPAAAAAYAYLRRQLWTSDTMADPGIRRPPRLVAEVLGTGQLPVDFFGDFSTQFFLTVSDGTHLLTNLRKGGELHAFLGRLTAEAAQVLGLADLTVLGVDRDGGAHILHSLCSVPVGLYNPDQRLFGCCREFPAEGLPAITNILVGSFAALRAVSAMSWDDHRVHLEGVFPSGWQRKLCKRASDKGEGQSLSCRGLTFLPPDAAVPLFHLEGSVGEISKLLFPFLADRETPYKEALNWLQFSFTGYPKGQYVAPPNTAFAFASTVEGGGLCFSQRSSASKPSTPGPTPGVLHLYLRVQN